MQFNIEIFVTLVVGSIATMFVGLIGAIFRTKTFVDWLDRHVLNGIPKTISDDDLKLINRYFEGDEIRVNGVLEEQPELSFQPYISCPDIANAIDEFKAKEYQSEQQRSGRPDDPHAFVSSRGPVEILQRGRNQTLLSYAIGHYSQLRALPLELKHRVLVLGANNLVIYPAKSEFIFHQRGETAETQKGKLHGFGGGYMPYWNDGNKTISVRRDDCKSLRYTAMRELHEESGLLSLAHVPDVVCVIEERHNKDSEGKFGYLTFFFITLIDDRFKVTFKGDPKEGFRRAIPITRKNLRSMILNRKYESLEIHPQLRAMLLVWVFLGCPGLHVARRLWLSNWWTLRSFRAALA
jgi:hypothetical protein